MNLIILHFSAISFIFYAVSSLYSDRMILEFNRWGYKIFETNNQYEGWNGALLNGKVQIDVYLYKIEYNIESKSGGLESKTITGTVTLAM